MGTDVDCGEDCCTCLISARHLALSVPVENSCQALTSKIFSNLFCINKRFSKTFAVN